MVYRGKYTCLHMSIHFHSILGYIDDVRNTDNAWVEAEIWNFHYGQAMSFPSLRTDVCATINLLNCFNENKLLLCRVWHFGKMSLIILEDFSCKHRYYEKSLGFTMLILSESCDKVSILFKYIFRRSHSFFFYSCLYIYINLCFCFAFC